MDSPSQNMDDFEKEVLKFIAGNCEWIENEEYEVDEIDGGTINPNDALKRVNSGWYGDQQHQRQRMDRELTLATLCKKAGCTEEDINSRGLYKFTHVSGESYVGKAEKQPLQKRLVQHLNKATSDQKLTGNFDPLLRDNPEMDDWHLQIKPMKQDQVASAEKVAIRKLSPTLNVQRPQ